MPPLLHVAPGAQGVHHWVYQILATLLIFGLWVYLAGLSERRRSARDERRKQAQRDADSVDAAGGGSDRGDELVARSMQPPAAGDDDPKPD